MHAEPQLPDLIEIDVPEAENEDVVLPDAPAFDDGPPPAPAPVADMMDAVGHYADEPPKRGEKRTRDSYEGRETYEPWEHGSKGREQKRLRGETGMVVSGKTHQSEHTIGFEPLAQTGDLKRGSGGRAKVIENHAPAYQEVLGMHADHIGTGTTNQRDASGMNSHEYRDAQRSLFETGDVSSAVQMNQLGYAHLDGFQAMSGWEADAADNSFEHMATNVEEVLYADGQDDRAVSVPPIQRAEMLLSRQSARTGEWPKRADMAAAWAQLGYVEPSYESDTDEMDSE